MQHRCTRIHDFQSHKFCKITIMTVHNTFTNLYIVWFIVQYVVHLWLLTVLNIMDLFGHMATILNSIFSNSYYGNIDLAHITNCWSAVVLLASWSSNLPICNKVKNWWKDQSEKYNIIYRYVQCTMFSITNNNITQWNTALEWSSYSLLIFQDSMTFYDLFHDFSES